jgi:hypothetical protein
MSERQPCVVQECEGKIRLVADACEARAERPAQGGEIVMGDVASCDDL